MPPAVKEPVKEKKTKNKGTQRGAVWTVVGGLGAIALAVVGLPFALAGVCRAVDETLPRATLPALWALYAALLCLCALWWRRGRLTLDSFATHNAAHLVLSLGAYHFLHVAERVPGELRRTSLLVWVSATMALNVAALFLDTTDYAAAAAKDAARERRREERRKLRLAEREARMKERKKPEKPVPLWRRNRAVKIALDVLVYAAMAGAVAWIAWSLRRKAADINAGGGGGFGVPNADGRQQKEKVWGYESMTGMDHKPLEVEDYELEESSVGETKQKPSSNTLG